MCAEPDKRYRDGGYGWVVVMSAFYISFITDGVCLSYGIILVELVDVFQSYRLAAAIPVSLSSLFMYLLGPVAGRLCQVYGHRNVVVVGAIISTVGFVGSAFVTKLYHLYITYGLFIGIGYGLMFTPATICVLQNFDKRRSLALGIAVCGSGIGTFVFSALTRLLLDEYGWRGTFLLLSGSSLNAVIFGLLLLAPNVNNRDKSKTNMNNDKSQMDVFTITKLTVKSNEESRESAVHCVSKHGSVDVHSDVEECHVKAEVKDSSQTEPSTTGDHWCPTELRRFCLRHFNPALLKSFNFQMFLVATLVFNLGFDIPFQYLPDQSKENGISQQKGAWLTSAVGITSTVGHVALGWMGDRKVINRFWLFVLVISLVGISTGLSVLYPSFEWKMAYACIYGIFVGGYNGLEGVVLADLVSAEDLSEGYGLNMVSIAIGAVIGTPLGGWLFDVSGSYNTTFIISGLFFLLGGLILVLPKLVSIKKSYVIQY